MTDKIVFCPVCGSETVRDIQENMPFNAKDSYNKVHVCAIKLVLIWCTNCNECWSMAEKE